jgi:uncharacterized cupredoxin-like copper-binding protein
MIDKVAAMRSLAAACALVSAGCAAHHRSAVPVPAAGRARPQTTGRAALESEAQRTVPIELADDGRFHPAEVGVRAGEIVTFELTNRGRQEHEFTVGDLNAQELHEYQMATMDMASMPHGSMSHLGKDHEKYMERLSKRTAELDRVAGANASVHVPPGETRRLSWAFTGQELPVYGCHLPGHWAAGMKGTFVRS